MRDDTKNCRVADYFFGNTPRLDRLHENNKMEELAASLNADHDMETPDKEVNQENIKCAHLFNCDQTYELDKVKKLFWAVERKLNFAFSIKSQYFALQHMSQLCENIIPDRIKVDDVAVFVVHAHESRLSINEDNAGIGYAKIYRTLLQATGEVFCSQKLKSDSSIKK